MTYITTIYEDYFFNLSYNDSELINLIETSIYERHNCKKPYFNYYSLCEHILCKAKENDALVDYEPNTYYESLELSQAEETRISRLLWYLILEHKIFFDFSNKTFVPITDRQVKK